MGLGLSQRSLRGVVAAAVAIMGILAVTHSIGVSMAARNPNGALGFAPWNSVALTQSAIRILERGQKGQLSKLALAQAQRAIQRDPTSADALGVVGLIRVQGPSARKAFLMSQQLSRRALRTQLWLIEDAVQRDDIGGALVHYDTALRTSLSAPSLLFPILVEAVSDPALVAPLAAIMAKRPAWGGQYLQQMAQSGTSLDGIARLFETLLRRGIDPGAAASTTLNERLVAANAWEQAWRLYAASHPTSTRVGVRPFAATDPGSIPPPFEWRASDNAALLSRIQLDAVQSVLMFSSATGEGGEAARQLLLLLPGAHTLSTLYGPLVMPANASPFLKLNCASGAEIGRLTLSATGDTRLRAKVAFVVPSNCPAQWISLVLQPASTGELIEGSIRQITIN